jgi:hypothetical protein
MTFNGTKQFFQSFGLLIGSVFTSGLLAAVLTWSFTAGGVKADVEVNKASVKENRQAIQELSKEYRRGQDEMRNKLNEVQVNLSDKMADGQQQILKEIANIYKVLPKE